MRNKIAAGILTTVLGITALTGSVGIGGKIVQAKETSEGSGNTDEEGVLRLAYPSTLTSVDVLEGGGAVLAKEVARVAETLVDVTPEFELTPALAETWERTDEKTWEFKLREDVTFHDGTELDAKAVKWCLDRSLEGNESLAKTTGIESIEAVDDHTVRFHMKEASGELPEALSNPATVIIAPTSVNEEGEVEKMIGTGYFQQESFDVADGTFICVPYDGYYKDVDTNVKKRVILSMEEPSTRSLSVQNDELDVASDIPFSDLEILKDTEGVVAEPYVTDRVYFYYYNTYKEWLKDKNVRKALIYAIDKEEIVSDMLMGVGSVPDGIFSSDVPWADTEVDTYEYDPQKALTMLEEAGYTDSDQDGFLDKDGEKLSVTIVASSARPGNTLITQGTQGYFQSIGIDASVKLLEGNSYYDTLENGEFDLCLNSATTSYVPSASYYLEAFYHSDCYTAGNSGYSNPELDALIEKCKSMEAGEEKNEVSRQAQQIAQDDAALFTVAGYGSVFAFSDRMDNFTFSPAAHEYIASETIRLKE